MTYIHELPGWPNFTWRDQDYELLSILGKARNLQGRLIGSMETLGFTLRQEAVLENLTLDVIKSSEIEGEFLDIEQVRSSLARRLGMDIAGLIPSDRNTDGVVEMLLDATQRSSEPLTRERLFDWHAALFPTGRSGRYKIVTGAWRTDETGPMQVVSGVPGNEHVHFQAPDAGRLDQAMNDFIAWINQETPIDTVLKAGIAHLWFITIHPFDDGNGRIARAITDMLLARADGSSQRFYSMSAQIRIQRKQYYEILEKTQKGSLDISAWLIWFLNCWLDAITNTQITLGKVLQKAKFWERHQTVLLNERQRLLLIKLLDGFDGKLTVSKWAKIAKCSADTALRDIQDLIQKGILYKGDAGGRSTNYELLF